MPPIAGHAVLGNETQLPIAEAYSALLIKNQTLTTIDFGLLCLFGPTQQSSFLNVCCADFDFYHVPSCTLVLAGAERNYGLLSMPRFGRMTTIVSAQLNAICARNRELQWASVAPRIVDIVLALAPLELPAYVLLWIIDWLPHFERAVNHFRKIKFVFCFTISSSSSSLV